MGGDMRSGSADHAARTQGHYDVGFNNPGRLDVSGNTTALAKDGIILMWPCAGPGGEPLRTFRVNGASMLSILTLSGTNDFLVGHCEGLVLRSLAAGKPFLCVVFFHGVHIPFARCHPREPHSEL